MIKKEEYRSSIFPIYLKLDFYIILPFRIHIMHHYSKFTPSF